MCHVLCDVVCGVLCDVLCDVLCHIGCDVVCGCDGVFDIVQTLYFLTCSLLLDRENISPQSDDQTFHWKLVLMNGIRHKTIITLNCNCLGPIWHNN